MVKPRDLSRLASLYEPIVEKIVAVDVDFRESETVFETIDRSLNVSSTDEANFQRLQRDFTETSGGSALLKTVAEYQRKTLTELSSEEGVLFSVIEQASLEAQKAVNKYANDRGFDDIYQ